MRSSRSEAASSAPATSAARASRIVSPLRARRVDIGEAGLELGDAAPGLGELVGHRDRRHDDEAVVADLAEALAQARQGRVDVAGELLQMALLALAAGHAVGAPGDGDTDRRHQPISPSAVN